MGVGITSSTAATEEGQRAHAGVVVMARVDKLSMVADPSAGTTLACASSWWSSRECGSISSCVRTVATEVFRPKRSSPPTPQVYDRRGRTDPVYLAVAHALDGMLPELAAALRVGRAALRRTRRSVPVTRALAVVLVLSVAGRRDPAAPKSRRAKSTARPELVPPPSVVP